MRRTGLVASTTELSVGEPGWLRLWGVAVLPSVDTLAKGDAPSSPELTVGGEGACLTGFHDVVPGIIRQGRERALDGPRNYPSGEKERYGRD